MSSRLTSPQHLFFLHFLLISILALFGPPERSLGTNVRVVYLHRVWVWAGLLGFAAAVLFSMQGIENIMHPASPILASNSLRIRVFFFLLLALTSLAAWQMSRWWHQRSSLSPQSQI